MYLNQFGRFAQIAAESLYFTMGNPFFLEIALSHDGMCASYNAWFLGPTRVLNPNGISIGSSVFAGLTPVTDRQTHRQTTLLGL